ncbi:MAG: hypothetical protein M1453_07925 [Acidobacteria bacterium]|nr:hypothetical protein [Acidobacteriota bacterium]MCL5287904.1 hypothetical protein [Acidobacteriota bacterium]
MKQLATFLFVLLTFSLASCGVVKETEKERADITAAIQKYLNERSGLNLAAMNWEIKNLNTDRDTASVQVAFTAKQGGASMVMEYQMKRVNNVWTVQKSGLRGSEGMPAHPGAEAAPAAPPAGTGTGALPPGHPTVPPQTPAPTKAQPAPPKKSS